MKEIIMRLNFTVSQPKSLIQRNLFPIQTVMSLFRVFQLIMSLQPITVILSKG